MDAGLRHLQPERGGLGRCGSAERRLMLRLFGSIGHDRLHPESGADDGTDSEHCPDGEQMLASLTAAAKLSAC
ncbi:hypothetical protein GCM10027056_26840 [Glaciibacter psychrotolerans]